VVNHTHAICKGVLQKDQLAIIIRGAIDLESLPLLISNVASVH
jgi:hypothetical protein